MRKKKDIVDERGVAHSTRSEEQKPKHVVNYKGEER